MSTVKGAIGAFLPALAVVVPLLGSFAIASAQVIQQQAEGMGPMHDQAAGVASVTAPQPALERPTLWGEPTEVRIGVYVIDVDGVDSANQNFSASVYT